MYLSSVSSFNRLLMRAAMVLIFGTAIVASSAAQAGGRKLITRVEPTCPDIARKFHIGGAVRVLITIAPDGKVKMVKAIGGHPVLMDAAVSAVRQWQYESSATETVTTVEIQVSPGT